MGNDNIQQSSSEGPEYTHTHTLTHIEMACTNAQKHREAYNKKAARGMSRIFEYRAQYGAHSARGAYRCANI